MDDVKLHIDNIEVEGDKGMTILEAAEKAGINIPTLCHSRDFIPTGACRVCVVEVEGSARLVGSCHTPIAQGMVIYTRSPKVITARKATVELLLAGHTGPCVTDARTDQCDLHKIASDFEVGPPRFKVREPRYYPLEEMSPYVRRDLSKCILCYRCIRACTDLAKKEVFATAYRGSRSKIIVDFDVPLNKEVCRDCGICIDYCPTSALIKPNQASEKKEGKGGEGSSPQPPLHDVRRGGLLMRLKKAQENSGYVSQNFMAKTAKSLNLSFSDIYGVATFYSFLSTQPLGRNVIRVCRGVPCYLKGSQMVIKGVKKTVGIKPGETTPDRRFSFELANCIGACDRAPAMRVNHDVHGDLTPRKISKILRSYR
jgi:NADH:ubiquinone oxidoreductase subunit E/Pyruvate/2-oxoacid:ferredoxin oxidoreductase delta subunit